MATQLKMLDEVLSNFDFDKTQKAMDLLDWKWARGLGLIIPTIDDLYKTSRGILEDAIELAYKSTQDNGTNSETCRISTGGFKATARVNRLGEVLHLDLEFILASWNVENEDLYEDAEDYDDHYGGV